MRRFTPATLAAVIATVSLLGGCTPSPSPSRPSDEPTGPKLEPLGPTTPAATPIELDAVESRYAGLLSDLQALSPDSVSSPRKTTMFTYRPGGLCLASTQIAGLLLKVPSAEVDEVLKRHGFPNPEAISVSGQPTTRAGNAEAQVVVDTHSAVVQVPAAVGQCKA